MDKDNILDTIKMLDEEKLDIRTLTMGISLLDCIDSDYNKACDKIYDKLIRESKDFLKVSDEISKIYGVPIVNNRISVTPISIIAAATDLDDYTIFAKTLDMAAKEIGIDFIGGFSALVQKGMTSADEILIKSIPRALAETDLVCASINIGSTKTGINMDAAGLCGETIKNLAENTENAFGCAKLVVFANAVEDNPFMAGAFHGVGEADTVISVGISGPGVVKAAISDKEDLPLNEIYEIIKKTAFKITRMGELVCKEVCKKLGKDFGIVDLSLAPTPAVGDSVGRILQEIGIDKVGVHGTIAALAMLNDAVKKGGIMASSRVGGLSGAFIPVSEDEAMIEAAGKGWISFDKLEAMTCVCSVGLDMIAIPGKTTAESIAAMIADEAALGVINNKTTAVRIIPVPGKDVGESVQFGGLLGYAPIIDVGESDSSIMIKRGGFIPAPVHSFKN